MKRTLIEMLCITLKYMPRLLYPAIMKDELKKENSEKNNKMIEDEVAVDGINTEYHENLNNFCKENSITKINLGCGSLEDYKIINAYKVNEENINDINKFLKGRNLYDKSHIKKEANSAAVTLIRINEGNGTIFNYKKFKINILPSELHIINMQLKKLKEKKQRNLTLSEIKDFVLRLTKNIKVSMDRINEGKGLIEDFKIIGIDELKEDNIYDINKFLKDKNVKTPNKIRSEIKRFFSAINKISIGIGTLNNYKAIGINVEGKKIKLINSILKDIYERDKQQLNVKEIIDISENIMDNFNTVYNKGKLEIDKKIIISDTLGNESV